MLLCVRGSYNKGMRWKQYTFTEKVYDVGGYYDGNRNYRNTICWYGT